VRPASRPVAGKAARAPHGQSGARQPARIIDDEQRQFRVLHLLADLQSQRPLELDAPGDYLFGKRNQPQVKASPALAVVVKIAALHAEQNTHCHVNGHSKIPPRCMEYVGLGNE
jgi:hypothetical protein